jgi:hypothetical protein
MSLRCKAINWSAVVLKLDHALKSSGGFVNMQLLASMPRTRQGTSSGARAKSLHFSQVLQVMLVLLGQGSHFENHWWSRMKALKSGVLEFKSTFCWATLSKSVTNFKSQFPDLRSGANFTYVIADERGFSERFPKSSQCRPSLW